MDIVTRPDEIYQIDQNLVLIFLLSTEMWGICQPLYMIVGNYSFVEVGPSTLQLCLEEYHRQLQISNVCYYMFMNCREQRLLENIK